MKLSHLLRRAPKAPTLRERAAALRASLPHQDAEQAAAPRVGRPVEPPAAVEPDPALAAAADYRAAWDAVEVAAQVTGDVPDEESETMAQAYDRLREARPTTAAGFRALAEAWAMALNGERGNEPSLMLADHAADSLIAGAGACVPTPMTSDAELLRLGAQLDAAHAGWRAAVEASREPDQRYTEALSKARARGAPTGAELNAAWELPGVSETHEAFDNLHPICEAIWQMPARTPAGLAVKARAALVHIWPNGRFEADAALGEEERLSKESARRLIEACCATAGVNWKGEPLDGRPATVESADPVLAAIEAHEVAYAEWDRLASVSNGMLSNAPGYAEAEADAYLPGRREIRAYEALFVARPVTLQGAKALAEYLAVAVRRASSNPEPSDGERALQTIAGALTRLLGGHREVGASAPSLSRDESSLTNDIVDGWAAWGALLGQLEDETPYELAMVRRRELLNAAMELPATAASIVPKALASAWMEWVQAEHPGQPRDGYDFADRFLYDIHATIMGQGTAGSNQGQTSRSINAPPNLVGMVDFTSATMDELRALHDTANEVGSFAYAMTWGDRCNDRTWSARGMGSGHFNAAGTLMDWLGDALASVETAALEEAKRRTPDNAVDRSTRLELMARPILENDDPNQIEALGRELLSHAAAERARS